MHLNHMPVPTSELVGVITDDTFIRYYLLELAKKADAFRPWEVVSLLYRTTIMVDGQPMTQISCDGNSARVPPEAAIAHLKAALSIEGSGVFRSSIHSDDAG
jgi:hypothetical protein